MADIEKYYKEQALTGVSGYRGSRYQRGAGIFSWLKNLALPVLKFLGKEAAATALHTASDALDGENFKESAKKHLKQSGKNTVKYLANRISGSGRQCRRKTRRRLCIKRKSKKKRKTVRKKAPKRRLSKRDRFGFI